MQALIQLAQTVQRVYADAGRALTHEEQATWSRTLRRLPEAQTGFLLDMLTGHICPGGRHGAGLQPREMVPVLEEVLACA